MRRGYCRCAPILAAGAMLALAALPARAEDPVKAGMSGPFSGGLSLLGQSVRDGVEVAFGEVNEKGGVDGRKLQFIAEDDGYEPMRTIASARKLVEQDKVAALLAVTGTAPSAALPFVTESKTPLLFPYAFAHSLTTPLEPRCIYDLAGGAGSDAGARQLHLKELKQTKVAAIYQNDDFGQDGWPASMRALARRRCRWSSCRSIEARRISAAWWHRPKPPAPSIWFSSGFPRTPRW